MAHALRVVLSLLVAMSLALPVMAFAQAGGLKLATRLATQTQTAYEAGQYQAAARLGLQALKIAVGRDSPDLIWRLQVLLGETYLKTGDLQRAEAAFRSAQAAVDLVNGSLASDRAKRQFGVGKSQITARLIDFDLAARNADRLFEDAERGRARAFVDLLTDSELSLSDDSQTNQRVRALDARIRNLRLKLSLQSPGSAVAVALKSQIAQSMEERAALMDKLAAINTEWAAAYSVRYGTLGEVQARLGRDEMLVYSVTGSNPNDIHLMFVQPDGASFKHIPNGQLEVNKALLALTDAVALADKFMQQEALGKISAALELQNWPAASYIYMVPSKQLHFVPWTALELGQWVSVLPNGSWLLRTAKKSTSKQKQVIVGDPDFSGELPQLPGARAEATLIARQFNVEPVLGRQATSAAIAARAQKKLQVLHLATHGVFDYQEPLRSALFFSGENNGVEAMNAEDIFRRPLRADLVVLSACETGVGQVLDDNDILGLLRSFYMNGASQAVNTLWPVSDQGAQQFMAVFYDNLSHGTGIALSKAVQASKQAGHAPAVYAAFVLNGYTAHAVAP